MTRTLRLPSALLFSLAIGLALPAMPAVAAQSLAPSPYPSTAPGAAPLNPAPMGTGAGQSIMATPYPQATGASSQGNPTDMHMGGSQQRLPSTYRQKYDTDQK